MTEVSKSPKKPANADVPQVVTLSAQVTPQLTAILDTAMTAYGCDRATLIRLAARLFIEAFYDGGGQWQQSDDLRLHIMASRHAHDAAYQLKY